MRAAHLIIDGKPAVLSDTVAARPIGGGIEAKIRANAGQLQMPETRGPRSYVLPRSRFAEDALTDAVADGARWYANRTDGFEAPPRVLIVAANV